MYPIHYAIHSIFMYIILVRRPASLFFLGPARIPLVISRGCPSLLDDKACEHFLPARDLLMYLLARNRVMCVSCIDFVSFPFRVNPVKFRASIRSIELFRRMLEYLIQ